MDCLRDQLLIIREGELVHSVVVPKPYSKESSGIIFTLLWFWIRYLRDEPPYDFFSSIFQCPLLKCKRFRHVRHDSYFVSSVPEFIHGGLSRQHRYWQQCAWVASLFFDFSECCLRAWFSAIAPTLWEEVFVGFGDVENAYLLYGEIEHNGSGTLHKIICEERGGNREHR